MARTLCAIPTRSLCRGRAICLADRAVLRWRYSWRAAEDAAGHVRGVDIFRVRDGKVAEKLSYVKG
ncbi:MAG: nuclear transport factor 2 family protein [Caldilineaceae bacterium]